MATIGWDFRLLEQIGGVAVPILPLIAASCAGFGSSWLPEGPSKRFGKVRSGRLQCARRGGRGRSGGLA